MEVGFQTRSWEIEVGAAHDLTDRRVLMKLRSDLQKHKVLAAMLAPPCGTFSVLEIGQGLFVHQFIFGDYGDSNLGMLKKSGSVMPACDQRLRLSSRWIHGSCLGF